ncbi:MAG: hypothetical protein ACK4YP_03610, partial [Myxococcota bacterium]
AEVWYDGVDQDCNPATEHDADGDGVAFPLDCHDDDPDAWTCDEKEGAGFRGCATTTAPASLAVVALAALAARRRRGASGT